jgi:hypothetical protein
MKIWASGSSKPSARVPACRFLSANGPDGKAIPTHLCVVVDDHSRRSVFARYYTHADTAAFLDCFMQGVLRRGLPAKPYRVFSKGKVERLIQNIQRDFELTLRLHDNAVHSPGELNTALSKWIASIYYLRVHSSTGQSPRERFSKHAHAICNIEDPDKTSPATSTGTSPAPASSATPSTPPQARNSPIPEDQAGWAQGPRSQQQRDEWDEQRIDPRV